MPKHLTYDEIAAHINSLPTSSHLQDEINQDMLEGFKEGRFVAWFDEDNKLVIDLSDEARRNPLN